MLGIGLEAVLGWRVAQQQALRALHDGCRRAGIEVEDEQVRLAHATAGSDRPLRDVELERREVGAQTRVSRSSMTTKSMVSRSIVLPAWAAVGQSGALLGLFFSKKNVPSTPLG